MSPVRRENMYGCSLRRRGGGSQRKQQWSCESVLANSIVGFVHGGQYRFRIGRSLKPCCRESVPENRTVKVEELIKVF